MFSLQAQGAFSEDTDCAVRTTPCYRDAGALCVQEDEVVWDVASVFPSPFFAFL
jgi:hypothetical protein